MAANFYHSESTKALRKLRQLKPELFASFIEFDKKVFEEGALSAKIKELIAIGTAHVTQCPFCIDAHTQRAKKAGASDAEIAESRLRGHGNAGRGRVCSQRRGYGGPGAGNLRSR